MKQIISFLFMFLLSFNMSAQNQQKENDSKSSKESSFSINLDDIETYLDSDGTKIGKEEFFTKKSNSKKYAPTFSMTTVNGKMAFQLVKKEVAINRQLKKDESNNKKINTALNDFKLKTLDGRVLKLKKLKDKVLVLNFWFAECKPCINEMPELNKLVKEFEKNNDVEFIAITYDKKDKIVAVLSEHPFAYQQVTDSKKLISELGISYYPTHVIVKDGIIKYFSSSSNTEGLSAEIKKQL